MALTSLFLLLVLMPTQLGKHWWPDWSLVSGIRVDYLSPTLFLTDVILVALVGLSLWENRKRLHRPLKRLLSSSSLFLIFYLLFLIFISPRPLLSLYWIARYAQIPLVVFVTRAIVSRFRRTAITRFIRIGLSVAVVWTVGLAALQIILGRTTGRLWMLGERSFHVMTPGISTVSVFGNTLLRPYATFPHPNALAGFLAICWILLRDTKRPRQLFIRVARAMSGIGVLLTASRLAVVSLAIASLMATGVGRASAFLTFPPQSVGDRVTLARAAIRMILDYPLFGVGPGQFLVRLPYYLPRGTWLLQPVHNIPLLLLSEFGLIGTFLIVWMIWRFFRSSLSAIRYPLFAILLFLLLTSLGDHYWLTVQQNRLLLGVVLGIYSSNRSNPFNH